MPSINPIRAMYDRPSRNGRSNINSGHICRSECPCLLRYNFPTVEFRMVCFGPCVFDCLCKLNLTYVHHSQLANILVSFSFTLYSAQQGRQKELSVKIFRILEAMRCAWSRHPPGRRKWKYLIFHFLKCSYEVCGPAISRCAFKN